MTDIDFGNTYHLIAEVTDMNGVSVGEVERTFQRFDDSITVEHKLMSLDPQARGSGFSGEFNAKMEGWYRESGVDKIRLTANIDVGSYAWARQGYTFAD